MTSLNDVGRNHAERGRGIADVLINPVTLGDIGNLEKPFGNLVDKIRQMRPATLAVSAVFERLKWA